MFLVQHATLICNCSW